MIKYYQKDCMEGMKEYPDIYFDLAIVDPPYGIGIVSAIRKSTKRGTRSMYETKGGEMTEFDDEPPGEEYFKELFRVSRNQIIWGGNYFIDHLHSTKGFAVWDKMNGTNPLADVELAWTSYDKPSRMFRMHHFSAGYDSKIHPTQKPVALYRWLLQTYAKKGDRILDTHVGSASSLIACYDMGFDAVGYEIDTRYYQESMERLEVHMRQGRIEGLPEYRQIGMVEE